MTEGGDIPGDLTRDSDSTVWMSYAELGRARGISPASAKRLAMRRHWRRHQGNDGTARVAVPVTEATRRIPDTDDAIGDDTGDVAAFESALAAIEAAHASEISTLRSALDAAERARLTAQTLADQALAMGTDANARADAAVALAAEATRISDDLHVRIDRAEQALTAERVRADTLRERIEEMTAAHAAELAAARDRVQRMAEAAEALNQAEAARKGRGVLARLRAVWRGE